MKVEYVFPTPVWFLETTEHQITAEALKWALEQRNKLTSSERSNRLGYQSEVVYDFESLPYWGHVHHRLKELNDDIGYHNWWINISERGSFNHYHVHPQCNYAVIWYLTDNHGTLRIRSPYHNTSSLSDSIVGPTEINVTARAGDIVVFPAFVEHCVEPHMTDDQRVSISINAS